MQLNKNDTAVVALLTGLALAVAKMIYSFFDPYHILDVLAFFVAGFAIGKKQFPSHPTWGLVLALPACMICFVFVLTNGITSIMHGIGTSYAISLAVIPVSACIEMVSGSAFKRNM